MSGSKRERQKKIVESDFKKETWQEATNRLLFEIGHAPRGEERTPSWASV